MLGRSSTATVLLGAVTAFSANVGLAQSSYPADGSRLALSVPWLWGNGQDREFAVGSRHKQSPQAFEVGPLLQLRQQASKVAAMQGGGSGRWVKSPVEPVEIVKLFAPLRIKPGFTLRAYVCDATLLGTGCVWALPADAEFPDPEDRTKLVALYPPKPLRALDDCMEAIEGDGSLRSYLLASILHAPAGRIRCGWHGLRWTTHVLLRSNPLEAPEALPATDDHADPGAGILAGFRTPSHSPWAWLEPQPVEWRPVISRAGSEITVVLHTYSPLGQEAIYRHVDRYAQGGYKFTTEMKRLATGSRYMVF